MITKAMDISLTVSLIGAIAIFAAAPLLGVNREVAILVLILGAVTWAVALMAFVFMFMLDD